MSPGTPLDEKLKVQGGCAAARNGAWHGNSNNMRLAFDGAEATLRPLFTRPWALQMKCPE
jgi:hypothetical protein